jgi:probable phosphoglycerate mutase
MTRIVLVRHGQTEWNRVERFRGRADVPLNETGLAQAEATGQRVAVDLSPSGEWRPMAVYSSPLSRAVKTAEAIARRLDLAVQIHARIADIDYGQWQGLTPDEVRERWPEIHHAWYNAPQTARIPGGETLDEIRVRAMKAVGEIATRHAEQTVALVSHTVVNRVILLAILGLGNDRFWRLGQDTCAINVFEADAQAGDFTLVSLNDTCHLRGA